LSQSKDEELYQFDSDSDSPVNTPVAKSKKKSVANAKKEKEKDKELNISSPVKVKQEAKQEVKGSKEAEEVKVAGIFKSVKKEKDADISLPLKVKKETKEEAIPAALFASKKAVKEETMPATVLVSKSTAKFFEGKKVEKDSDSSSKQIGVSTVSEAKAGTKAGYQPNLDSYHPIDDACWSQGQPVPYTALAQTLYCMEQTSKRLELLSMITNYFRSVLLLTPKDLVPSMYILTNKVAPDYDTLELGLGDTVLFKALADATGSTMAKLKIEFQTKGDIGLVAESSRCNQKLIFTPKKLTVNAVFTKFREIASISGNSSRDKKCDLIKGLLVSCDAVEARYLMRSLAGKLRNGLGELSILTALAHACTITPPLINGDTQIVIDKFKKLRASDSDEMKKMLIPGVEQVKNAYHQCPNYERVVEAICKHGLDDLVKYCKICPGVPLKPMLANPTKGIHEVLKRFDKFEFTCEYKYDGERAQIHILEDGSVNIYSRNSENNTGKYPDVISNLKEILNLKKESTTANGDSSCEKVFSAILDSEIVAYDSETKTIKTFQELSTRKRKDVNAAEIKIHVCIFAFDLIYLNGESLTQKSLRERREIMRKYFPHVESKLMFAVNMNSNDTEDIQEFLDQSIKDGCEGLMLKTLDQDAHYEISKRSYNWLKLKKDYLDGVGDTLDLVVIGGYMGTGKRTGVYGGYLLACYDEANEEYQTICKLGTGLKDDDLATQFESLSKIKIDKPKSYYRFNDTLDTPDHWFDAVQVWEIKCADFSLSPVYTAAAGIVDPKRGVSMRFPRFLKLRDDKKPEDATSSEQVSSMYKNQQQMINQNQQNDKNDDFEDDY
jgi:DNA ligase-1